MRDYDLQTLSPIKAKDLIVILGLLLALLSGLWLPLRMVIFPSSAEMDQGIDFVFLVFCVFLIYKRYTRYISEKKVGVSRSRFGLVISIVAYALMAFPIYSLLNLTQHPLLWVFSFKLLILVRLKDLRQFTDRLEIFHPVMARLLPLAIIVPIMVHAAACGWSIETHPDRITEYVRAVYRICRPVLQP